MGKPFMIKQLIQIKKDMIKIRKLTAGQGKDYTTGLLKFVSQLKTRCKR